jgi:hypothetical protein
MDCLGHVEVWVPAEIERLYAIVDNLNVYRATDVLLFCLQHPPTLGVCLSTKVCGLSQPH